MEIEDKMNEQKQNNGLGIASMILGIFGFLIGWVPFLGLPFCIVGLGLGLIQKNWTNNGIAITGVTLNSLWLFIQILWVILMLISILAR